MNSEQELSYLKELQESNSAHIEACGQWNEKYYKLQQESKQAIEVVKRLEQWKQRLQSKAHLIEYTHEILIDKINNEILNG